MIKSKAFQGPYIKSFHSKNVWTLMKAYKSFIRPIVEYGSPIWSPHLIQDIEAVETIQRFFTKKICGRANIPFTSYKDRLFKLNMRSLQYRRIESDLILTFKIVHNLVDIPLERFFSPHESPYNTRRHNYTFKLNHVKTNFEKSFFANRTPSVWNRLPPEIVNSSSFHMFVSKLKVFDLLIITQLLLT